MPSLTRARHHPSRFAMIEVTVAPTGAAQELLKAAGTPAPKAVTLRAIIDTGASRTCVGNGVLAPLGCDILASGLLIYNGPAGAFTLCF